MSVPVLFILGAGSNIGLSVAKSFAAKGYKIALAARSFEDGVGEDGYSRLHIDLSNPEAIKPAFDKVREELGIPSVVVYNASSTGTTPRDPKDPLSSFYVEEINKEFAINTTSALFAAQETVKGFKQLPSNVSKTFILTGNALNGTLVVPSFLTFGMGKSATAAMIRAASVSYKDQGYKFYYADERFADGAPAVPVGGPAAGKAYLELAESKEQGPWDYTFVDGKGYVEF